MSLNGLEDAKVIEAHEAAIAEPGGWFLLKYASRDEVEVLDKGNGGIVEIRNAIAQYEESSPLFGFLRYRRRSVLIKYVPEDCSRLVQARLSVHFSAFTERFTPHDTVFPIASSKELRDVSLSAACSLHTASGSTSSSTSSLRRRRLMEITEEAEEDQRSKRQSTVHEERPTTGKESTRQAQLAPDNNNVAPTTNGETHTNANPPILPTSDNTPSSPTRRLSSQSVRPDMYTLNSYGTSNKPKIKLGPRPSLDHKVSSNSEYRPVSSLPAGLRLFRRGSKKQKTRPQSTYQSAGISRPITDDSSSISEMRDPIRPHTSGGRPTTSSGVSIRMSQLGSAPLGGLPPTSTSRATATMTPEKARLMKALQLRKKQMSSTNSDSLPQTPETVVESPNATEEDHYIKPGEPKREIARTDTAMTNDSGVVMTTGYATNDLCSEITKTDSSPTSPVGTEHAASTKASSFSESTEETVKEESAYPQDNLGAAEVIPEEMTDVESVDTDLHSLSDVEEAQEEEAEGKILQDEVPDDFREDEMETAKLMANAAETSLPTPPLDVESPIPATAVSEIEADYGVESDLDVMDIRNKFEATPSNDGLVTKTSEIPETKPPTLVATAPEDNMVQKDQIPSVADTNIRPELEATSIISPSEQGRRVETNEGIPASPVTTQSPPRDLKIPRSKFSMPDLRASENAAIEGQKDIQVTSAEVPPKIPTSLLEDSLLEEKDSSLKHRRKTSQIDRIRTDMSAANSDNEFLEDDDLMDELQSATVQEAKPISVAKSPMSQIFPVSPKKRAHEATRVSRVFSNPLLKEDLRNKGLGLAPPEKIQIGRSVSAGDAFLNRISQQQSVTAPKKVNVGSGISQRIKALEKLSSSSPATGAPPGSGSTSPAFFSVRQSSVRSTKSPSIADRANSLTRNSPSISPSPSYSPDNLSDATKLRDRADSVRSRKETFNNAPSSRTPSSSRPESISVTARIIRDPNQPFPQLSEAGKDPSEYGPLDLKSSPLIIDHQKAVPSQHETIQERRSSKEIKRERRSSITIVKDLLTSPRRSSFSSIGRRSITIEPPESSPRPETSASTNSRPPSMSSRHGNGHSPSISAALSSTSPGDSLNMPPLSGVHPKSEGRGMKMLRRMSSSFSTGRKTLANAISPTLREETEPIASSLNTPSQTSQLSIDSTDVGDVNVQFPDTLLWKRRHLLLDSQGFLILSVSQAHGASNAIAATKRYHMSDLKMPFVPDIESQELPNSVSLEFIQGGGLQFACEDRAAQSHVLHLLEDAYKAWANSQ